MDAFDFNPDLTDSQLNRTTKVRAAYKTLVETLLAEIPTSRARTEAMTKLEEACMWSIKGVTHNDTDLDEAQKADVGESVSITVNGRKSVRDDFMRAVEDSINTNYYIQRVIAERINDAKDWNY